MEIKGDNLCQYFWRINAPRDDAIATRGNLRLDRTNKRFEGTMRDLLLNKTFIQHDAGEKDHQKPLSLCYYLHPNYLTQGDTFAIRIKVRDYLFLH